MKDLRVVTMTRRSTSHGRAWLICDRRSRYSESVHIAQLKDDRQVAQNQANGVGAHYLAEQMCRSRYMTEITR